MMEHDVWVCRATDCPQYGELGWARCADLGHQEPERFVPISEVDRLRGVLAVILAAPEHAIDYARAALNAR